MTTFTVSQAKARLGRLADQAIKSGTPVLIRRGDSILELRERSLIEPIEHFAVGDLPVSETAIVLERLEETFWLRGEPRRPKSVAVRRRGLRRLAGK